MPTARAIERAKTRRRLLALVLAFEGGEQGPSWPGDMTAAARAFLNATRDPRSREALSLQHPEKCL